MKKKSFVFLSIIALGCCLLMFGQALAEENPPNLEFKIGLEVDTFIVNQPIWLDLYMTNMGEEKVGVKPLTTASDWLKIIIVDSNNDTIPYHGGTAEWIGEGPTYIVQSKETLYICRNILEGTGFGVWDNPLWVWGWSSLLPGTYRIKALYKLYLESNELTFTVVPAAGEEEKSLELLKGGLQHQLRKNHEIAIAKWLELAENYPSSVYTPSVLRQLCYYDPDNSQVHAKKLLSEYPNSGYSSYAIEVLLRGKTKEEKDTLLQQIEKEYQGTRAARLARNIARHIEAF